MSISKTEFCPVVRVEQDEVTDEETGETKLVWFAYMTTEDDDATLTILPLCFNVDKEAALVHASEMLCQMGAAALVQAKGKDALLGLLDTAMALPRSELERAGEVIQQEFMDDVNLRELREYAEKSDAEEERKRRVAERKHLTLVGDIFEWKDTAHNVGQVTVQAALELEVAAYKEGSWRLPTYDEMQKRVESEKRHPTMALPVPSEYWCVKDNGLGDNPADVGMCAVDLLTGVTKHFIFGIPDNATAHVTFVRRLK